MPSTNKKPPQSNAGRSPGKGASGNIRNKSVSPGYSGSASTPADSRKKSWAPRP